MKFTSSTFNFHYAAAVDCPRRYRRYLDVIDRLKSMVDIKPSVIKHSTTIRDKFPCNDGGFEFLERFVSNFYFWLSRNLLFTSFVFIILLALNQSTMWFDFLFGFVCVGIFDDTTTRWSIENWCMYNAKKIGNVRTAKNVSESSKRIHANLFRAIRINFVDTIIRWNVPRHHEFYKCHQSRLIDGPNTRSTCKLSSTCKISDNLEVKE